MKKLFEPATVGGLTLRNRLIRSATFEGAFDEQEHFAANLLPSYEKLASGGIGAIITGMVGVDGNSRVLPSMVKGYGETFIPELRQLTERVNRLGAKLIVQISHCGQKATQIENGGQALGPSDAAISPDRGAKGMSHDDIRAVAAAFAAVAARCKEAGADAVQLHSAHGYLLSQFLNPYYNKRTDEYGGDIKNRARIVLEVYEAVRAAVGPDYPVWIKINSQDLVEPGISPEEFLWISRELDRRGIDAVEVSGGAAVDAKSSSLRPVKGEADEGQFAREAVQLAENAAASIISVCGFRTPDVMKKWLNKGELAALSLCRPLISEPGLVNRWISGDRRPARCISCNKCFSPSKGIKCRAFPETA